MPRQPTGDLTAAHGSPAPARGGGPVGIVLAGGLGRRIGGAKAVVELDHRPLISYPLEAVWRALGNVAIVAKMDTELPSVPGVSVWIEPDEPRHPLTGIVHAISLADGRPVLICAADMPFVTTTLIRALADHDPRGRGAVVASSGGELQPLLGCYQATALEALSAVRREPSVALRDAVAAVEPVLHEVDDPELLFNVNTPDDLLQAAAMLGKRTNAAG
jgi:molybdenum cofactor guanylyltransferase